MVSMGRMPCEFIGFGAMDVTKPYKLIGFDDIQFTAIPKGFNKPHGMALTLACRAENRCKPSRAPAGAFPKHPVGPGWAGKRPKISDVQSYL